MSFAELVEEVGHLPMEEMIELREHLDLAMIERERERMHREHLESVEEWKSGKIQPTSDVDDLIRRLNAECSQSARAHHSSAHISGASKGGLTLRSDSERDCSCLSRIRAIPRLKRISFPATWKKSTHFPSRTISELCFPSRGPTSRC